MIDQKNEKSYESLKDWDTKINYLKWPVIIAIFILVVLKEILERYYQE